MLFRSHRADDWLVVCCNFTPVPRHGHRVGVPAGGDYDEIFNSDAAVYGGADLGNGGRLRAEARGHDGREHSLVLTLPPLAAVVLKPRPAS